MDRKYIIVHIGYSEKRILDTISSFSHELEIGSISTVRPVLASGIVQAMVIQFEDDLGIAGNNLADYWQTENGRKLRESIDQFLLQCRRAMLYNPISPDRWN